MSNNCTSPNPETAALVTQTGHRSPHGRPGTISNSGVDLCEPVPGAVTRGPKHAAPSSASTWLDRLACLVAVR